MMNSEIRFVLIAWDQSPSNTKNGNLEHLLRLLPSSVEVHRITDIIPDYRADKYTHSRYDRHPNALAHQKIASYLLEHVLAVRGIVGR